MPATPIHIKNSYASETPVTDGQRVYAYFGNVGVYCYDLDGKPLWSKEIEPQEDCAMAGAPAASPVLYQDRLYIVNDNDEESYLLALDARTGEEIFRVGARRKRATGRRPTSGRTASAPSWSPPAPARTARTISKAGCCGSWGACRASRSPRPTRRTTCCTSARATCMDKKKPIYAIRPGATAISRSAKDETKNDYILWCNKTAAPYNPSSLLYGDLMYVLYDHGFFGGFDPKTGEEVYEKKRMPEGKAFTSSPWAYDDKIFCLNEDGVTFVIRAGKEFEILHTNTLAEDDMCMATPAIVGDRLLLRTSARLYCIRKGASQAGGRIVATAID